MAAIGVYYRSSSFLVGLVFVTLLGIALGAVFSLLSVLDDRALTRETDAAVVAELGGLATRHAAGGRIAVERYLSSGGSPGFVYRLAAPGAAPLVLGLSDWPTATAPDSGMTFFEVEGTRYLARTAIPDPGVELSVGRDVGTTAPARKNARRLAWLMTIILAALSLLSLGIGTYVVSRINRISETTERIVTTGRLDERLPVDSSWDDLSKLATSLNRVLAELERRVGALRSASDNIAHDLRTPLTRLRARIESVPGVPDREALLEEVDRLLSILASILRISDIESSRRTDEFRELALTEIAADVVELYAPVAEEAGVALHAELGPARIFGDRSLTFQALANVVDNALKFTPHGGHVTVRLTTEGPNAVFEVVDSGPGIPADRRRRVLERFYRVDAARSAPGHGLGLALVAAVVELTGGAVMLADAAPGQEPPGLCCRLSFPSVDARAA